MLKTKILRFNPTVSGISSFYFPPLQSECLSSYHLKRGDGCCLQEDARQKT